MSSPTARRYALALRGEAEAHDGVEAVDADVEALAETLGGSRDLVALFASPVVPRHKKEAVVTRLFEGQVSDLVLRFIRLLVDKQREALLPEVLAAYQQLRDDRAGVVEAFVRTARPLGEAEAGELRKALEARAGQRVRMQVETDPALLGGVVVRLGDRVFDRSLRHQLGLLRAQLVERAQLSN